MYSVKKCNIPPRLAKKLVYQAKVIKVQVGDEQTEEIAVCMWNKLLGNLPHTHTYKCVLYSLKGLNKPMSPSLCSASLFTDSQLFLALCAPRTYSVPSFSLEVDWVVFSQFTKVIIFCISVKSLLYIDTQALSVSVFHPRFCGWHRSRPLLFYFVLVTSILHSTSEDLISWGTACSMVWAAFCRTWKAYNTILPKKKNLYFILPLYSASVISHFYK